MAITAAINNDYGGESTDIRTKYSVLNGINWQKDDVEKIASCGSKRVDLFAAEGLTLKLFFGKSIKSTLPPIIVPSSGRSNSIFAAFQEAEMTIAGLEISRFNGLSDLRGFDNSNLSSEMCPPIYCPLRNEEGRLTIILVHEAEFGDYYVASKGWKGLRSDFMLACYSFGLGLAGPAPTIGLGPSRFAALQLAKLYAAGATTSGESKSGLAWIVDDDIVGISNLKSFSQVEEMDGIGNYYACGFNGASGRLTKGGIKTKIEKAASVPFIFPKSLSECCTSWQRLHQVILVNTGNLKGIDFPIIFCASNGDPSFFAYLRSLNQENNKFLWGCIKDCTNFKSIYFSDNTVNKVSDGGKILGMARKKTNDALSKTFSEAITSSIRLENGKSSEYIGNVEECVKKATENPGFKNTFDASRACTIAGEQIMVGAINHEEKKLQFTKTQQKSLFELKVNVLSNPNVIS